jgi:ribosomal protein S18 acetylase RimI-like enzyme
VSEASGADGWLVNLSATDEEAHEALSADRVWSCFALADLLPPHREYAQFAVARSETRRAICLVLREPALTVVSPGGDPTGVAVLLERIALPGRALIQARAAHLPAVERYYRPISPWLTMRRMAVTSETFRPPDAQLEGAARLERLTADDLPDLTALYSLFPAGHFRPELLDSGAFFGVREGERLLAAGGTHTVAEPFAIAVVGNIFTHPKARRRGYASAVTAAIVCELFRRGMRDVALNVVQGNHAAISVYERLGFATALSYRTEVAERVAAPDATAGA